MDDATTIKEVLGLTQEEMAMVLGITPSQWSMYKSGKRDIGLTAKQQLGFLLKGVQQKEKTTEAFLQTEKKKATEKLQQDLRKVQIKQQRTATAIATLENHRREGYAALKVATLLENQKENNRSGVAAIIRSRALKLLHKHSLYQLEQLQLQSETLEMLKLKISKKISAKEK